MNYVGLTAVSLALAGLLCAIFVEIAGTGIFLRLEAVRRFSLRTMLIATTLVAMVLGYVVWMLR